MFSQCGARDGLFLTPKTCTVWTPFAFGTTNAAWHVRTRGRHALAVHSGDFFSTLKIERCHRRRHISRNEARADIFDCVERFCNPIRRPSTLANRSPVAHERAGAVAVA